VKKKKSGSMSASLEAVANFKKPLWKRTAERIGSQTCSEQPYLDELAQRVRGRDVIAQTPDRLAALPRLLGPDPKHADDKVVLRRRVARPHHIRTVTDTVRMQTSANGNLLETAIHTLRRWLHYTSY
jgi:hypothetical protein